MGVSQQAIADTLGISRTTVTKILNRDPKYSASESTREKVFRTAEKMGYDFTTIRRPFKREYGRTMVNVQCEVVIYLEKGEVFDKGTATARNIGVGGALLTELTFPRNSLPLTAFTMEVHFKGITNIGNLKASAQVVRLTDSSERDKPELGIKFTDIGQDERMKLLSFVDARLTEEEKKRLEKFGKPVS